MLGMLMLKGQSNVTDTLSNVYLGSSWHTSLEERSQASP
jgi:hypothetical protein